MNRPKEDETKCVRKEEKKRNRGKVAKRPMTWRELYRNGDPDGYFYFNFREGESAHARRKIKKKQLAYTRCNVDVAFTTSRDPIFRFSKTTTSNWFFSSFHSPHYQVKDER